MASRAAVATLPALLDNGIVRSTVFPNSVRDARQKKGFPSLTAFSEDFPDITYTRLAKIERGEIFPRADELVAIAKKLRVSPGALLVDVSDPSFDRDAWAREHVEASLSYRGGSVEDMKLGAALRVKRKAMNRSTTAMKDYFLAAATVSRIENAERPFSRWDEVVRDGVRMVFGAEDMSEMWAEVDRMSKEGEIAQTMFDLFSPIALADRQRKATIHLLGNMTDRRARSIRRSLMKMDSALNDNVTRLDKMSSVSTHLLETVDGISKIVGAGDAVAMNSVKAGAFGVKLDEPVMGPGYPAGSVLVFEPVEKKDVQDDAVIAMRDGDEMRIGFAIHRNGKLRLVQSTPSAIVPAEGDLFRLVFVANS